jgi:hypothetical protein
MKNKKWPKTMEKYCLAVIICNKILHCLQKYMATSQAAM